MTDKEKDKTEKEYKEWLVNDHKLLDNPTYCDIEQKCFRAFFAGTRYGLAEGRKENEELKTIILKLIPSKEIGYTDFDKFNDITLLCQFGIDDRFRRIRSFLFEE